MLHFLFFFERIFLVVWCLAHMPHVQAAPLDELLQPLLLLSQGRHLRRQPLPLTQGPVHLGQTAAPGGKRPPSWRSGEVTHGGGGGQGTAVTAHRLSLWTRALAPSRPTSPNVSLSTNPWSMFLHWHSNKIIITNLMTNIYSICAS